MNSSQEAFIVKAIESIDQSLKEILLVLKPAKPAKFIQLIINHGGRWEEVNPMQELVLKDNESVVQFRVKAILDEDGKPAKVDGDKIEWSMSGDALGELVVDSDGMGAALKRNGERGVCVVQARGDALIGEGEEYIVAEAKLLVPFKPAKFIDMSVEAIKDAEPVPQPEPVPVPEPQPEPLPEDPQPAA